MTKPVIASLRLTISNNVEFPEKDVFMPPAARAWDRGGIRKLKGKGQKVKWVELFNERTQEHKDSWIQEGGILLI